MQQLFSRLSNLRPLLVLCGIVFFWMLTACSQTPPSAPDAPTTGTPAAAASKTATPRPRLSPTFPATATVTQLEVAENELSGLEIVFWHGWDGATGAEMDRLVQEFNRGNEWKIQVRPEYQGSLDQLAEKMRQIATGEPGPQLVAAYLYQALNWGGETELATLDPYVNDPVWGLSPEQQNDFYPSIWQAEVIQGERLGIPALRSAQLLYYNDTWAGELGFAQAPQNWSQLEQQVCAASQALRRDDSLANDGMGGLAVTTDYSASLSWMAAFGAEIVDDSGNYRLDTPQVENTFEALRKLSESGCAWLVEAGSPLESFAGREGLITTSSLLEAPAMEQALQRAGSSDQWSLLPFPGPDGRATLTHYGPAYMILSSTPETELAAWVFVRWLLAPEQQVRWIEASGGLALQGSVAEELEKTASRNPDWAEAVELLPDSQAEPTQASWYTVRWALSDATVQLFRYYFSLDQVPDLVELLNETARELNER